MIEKIKKVFGENPDLVIRKVKINILHKIYVIFFDTLANQDKINEYILKKLTNLNNIDNLESLIPGSNIVKLKSFEEIEYYLYNGFTIIVNKNKLYAVETKANLDRSIASNEVEIALKGPKNAFNENYQSNIGLIKRRLKTNKLKICELNIGRLSKSKIAIMYIDGITKMDLIQKIKSKLENVDIDMINDSEDLKKYLTNTYVFPTIIATERPDRCAKSLSNGKVVIIAQESPTALILPAFLIDFLNPFSDYYTKDFTISMTKILRFSCFFLSMIVPAFYIAIISFNQEAVPTKLILNFAIQRTGVPFPAVIECIIMLLLCEILRESDLRFPNKYGSAISILGALVLGESAVSAGLITPIMIIVTSFTFITSLVFPEIEITNTLRVYRFAFLLGSSFFGLYGFLLMFLLFLLNLYSTESVGIMYSFPVTPFDFTYIKESILKLKNKKRSKMLSNNIIKEKTI